jgi:hypothetical protein
LGKTYHKAKTFDDDSLDDSDERKQNHMNKRLKKRFERALRIKNIDELLEYTEEEYEDGFREM